MERMSPSPSSVVDEIAGLPPPPFAGTSWGKTRGGGRPALPSSPFGRSTSVPEDHPQAAGEVAAHRRHGRTAGVSSSDTYTSDSARRILERMCEDLLQNARMGLLAEARHATRRRSSGSNGVRILLQSRRLSRKIGAEEERRRSSGESSLASLIEASRLPSFNDELNEIEEGVKLERRKSGGDNIMGLGAEEEEDVYGLFGNNLGRILLGVPREEKRGSGGRREDPGRRMSKSMGNLESSLFEDEMSSDEEEARATWKKKSKGNNMNGERRMSKSIGNLESSLFEDEMSSDEEEAHATWKNKSKGNNMNEERRMSKSMGNLESSSFEDEMSSDEGETRATWTKKSKGNNMNEERRYKSMRSYDPTLFQFEKELSDSEEDGGESKETASEGKKELDKMTACSLQVDFDFEHDDDETIMVQKHLDPHSTDPRMTSGNKDTDTGFAIQDSKAGRRRAKTDEAPSQDLPNRRDVLLSQRCLAAKEKGQWRPLSSDESPKKDGDRHPEDEDGKNRRKKNSRRPEQGGIGGLWNKLTSSLTSKSGPIIESELTANKTPAMRKKEADSATYFQRGKRKMAKDKYLQAVALFNLALVRQREELGENHIDCGTTLNEIGVCWLVMGERYPALTAFKEALYIRRKRLGDGAMEVAETTNNIWMIYHEERCEMEDGMAKERGEGDKGGCES